MSPNWIELLIGAITILGGLVWHSMEKRVASLELDAKTRAMSEQTLREAVIKLTVTVEHLMTTLGHRGDGQ